MKKTTMKKTVLMLATVCLCTSMQIPVNATDVVKTQETSESAKLLEEMIEEEGIIENDFKLTDEEMLTFEDYSKLCSYFMENAEEGEMYPDYISGVVYDENIVCVLTTGDVQQVKEELMTIVNIDNIVVSSVDYTYKELNDVKKEIEQICENKSITEESELQNLVNRIQNIVVDEKENKVTVGIENYTSEDEIILKKCISDFEKVHIYNAELRTCKTTLKPGARVWMLFGIDREGVKHFHGYSVGCRAYRINSSGIYEFGFITAGHGVEKGMKFYTNKNISKDNYIGKVTDFEFIGSVDASFVCVDVGNYSLSNQLAGTDVLKSGGYVYDNFNGSPCIFLGATSGRFLVGKVIEDNKTMSIIEYQRVKDPSIDIEEDSFYCKVRMGMPIKKLLTVSTIGTVQEGDSGGLLYTVKDGEYYVLGICSGIDGTYSYHTKYSEIIKEMGVNIY